MMDIFGGHVEDNVLGETEVSECRECRGGIVQDYNQWTWKSGASTVCMSLPKQRSMMISMVEQWNAKNRSEGLPGCCLAGEHFAELADLVRSVMARA